MSPLASASINVALIVDQAPLAVHAA